MVFAHVFKNTDHNFLDGEFGGHDGVPFFCAVLYLYDMATAQPFAYNPSRIPISGTTQSGDFAVGTPVTGFTESPQFWNGPDEDLGYVIAQPVPAGNQPNPLGIPAYLGFFRSDGFTDSAFLNLVNSVSGQNFANSLLAYNWLSDNGYYTDFIPITPTPTPTNTVTPTVTQTPTMTASATMTPTPSITASQTVTPTTTITPTNTRTPTPTNTETPTNTPTTTPTVTPTNPTLLQILNQTTGSRTVTSCTLDGVSQTLTSGSFPITAGNNGFALTHGQSVLPNSIQFNFGGSGTFDLYSYKNGVLVNYLASYNSSSYVAGGITLATSDQLILIITDPGALATPTPTSTPTPTPSAAVLSGLTVNINQVGPNVVMSASGTLNINGLTLVGSNLGPQNGGGIGIGTATFIMGTIPSNYDQYSGFTSTPSNFGTGGGAPPSSSSGDIFGCFYPGGPPHQLMVPVGYTTGSAISSTQTFNSTTLATLGLVTGTYTYSWGSGANAYSVNVVIS